MAKKPTKAATSQKTLVTFLLDRSSSMGSCWDATIESFNGYIDGLKKGAANLVDFSLVQFDQHAGCSLEKTCVATPISSAPTLSKQNYQPRGGTPLIEAATKVILAVAESLTKRNDKPQVVVCIQTDGEENASNREYTWEGLKKLIAEKTALGWQFNFMGAGIDAYDQGVKMGIGASSTMSYDSSNLAATRSAFGGRATATAMYASTGDAASMTISSAEKAAAGDAYDPTLNPTKIKKPTVTSFASAISGSSVGTTGQFSLTPGSQTSSPTEEKFSL